MNITYLIGAGASQQSLPIVAEMSKEIRDTIAWLSPAIVRNALFAHSAPIKGIIADLNSLADICEPKKNFSIDTYAKKLRISGDRNEYNKLKNTLSIFFTLQQQRKYPDVRYDNFWASILNEKDKLPNNIKIFSWNYDSQLEITYKDFIKSNSLKEAAKALNLITYKTSTNKYKTTNEFTIFKLNGSATFNSETIPDDQNYIIDDLGKSSDNNAIHKVLDFQTKRFVEIENHLSYAWEYQRSSEFFTHVLACARHTDVLVVIGYSFPFFNREVDGLIINIMGNLKKVYIQDPNAINIKERFLAIKDMPENNIKTITDTYQFTLPNEL